VQTKNHNYQPQDEKKFGYFFVHMYTHQAEQTPFMENPETKM
jgi:hypothetical protein